MTPTRPFARTAVAATLLLGCAGDPPPEARSVVPAASTAAPSAAPPTSPCEALLGPLRALRRQASIVSLARSMPVRPRDPAGLAGRLDELAAAARVTADDPALARIGADASARLAEIAAAARAYAQRGDDRARAALLAAMERGEMVVVQGEQRCVAGGGASRGKLSAAALESGTGRMPASLLSRALSAGAPAFQRCAQAGLARDRALQGAVRVRFVVDREGRVSEAEDEDRATPDPQGWAMPVSAPPVRDAEVRACVVAALRELSFPRPEGGSLTATHTIEIRSR